MKQSFKNAVSKNAARPAAVIAAAVMATALAGCADRYSYKEETSYCRFNAGDLSAEIIDAQLARSIVVMAEGKISVPGVIRGMPTLPENSQFPLSVQASKNRFTVDLNRGVCVVYSDRGFGAYHTVPLQKSAPQP